MTDEKKNQFKSAFADVDTLREVFCTIGKLTSEIHLNINSEGLRTVGMCPANVSLYNFEIKPTTMVEWNYTNDFTFWLNVNQFNQVLKNFTKKDGLIIQKIDDKELLIKRITPTIVQNFSIPLVDNEEKEVKGPNLEHTHKITMNTLPYNDLIKSYNKLTTSKKDSFSVRINCNKESVEFVLNEVNARTEFKNNANAVINTQEDKPMTVKYSLEYLILFLQKPKIFETFELRISKDYPAVYNFKRCGYSLMFILAPRVESD